MKRYVKATLCVVLGACIGLPAGYVFARFAPEHANLNSLNSDELHLTFPKKYFANLPKAGDGEEERIIDVGTFSFDTDGDGTPEPSSTISIPIVLLNSIS